jgi:small redox-active disulfide protein 2
MKIEILGTGCPKCNQLFERVKEAVGKSGKFAQIEKVQDPLAIVKYSVMSTPALVVDGEVKSAGKLLSVDEIEKFLS